MIQPYELRLGNFFNPISGDEELSLPLTTVFCKVVSISAFECESIMIDEILAEVEKPAKFSLTHVSPITISEEWLERLGFEKHYFGLWDQEELHGVILKGDGFDISYNEKWKLELNYGELAQSKTIDHIKHVHHLQNLYFALTGTELTVKELAHD